MKLAWNSGELAEGLRCYRDQQFFQAHEHWELVWLKCQGQEKIFLQALIQMACSFHHLQRNNYSGATSLLKAASLKLERCAAIFEGVEVASLREQVAPWLQALETPASPIQLPYPEIRLIVLSPHQ